MTQSEPNLIDDRLLLLEIETGSTHAFNLLFDKYWESSLNKAVKRVKDLEAAKDIVQEVFTQIWINRETTHIENFQAYLNIAIRNRVLKFFTKQKIVHPFFHALDNISEKNMRADSQLLWKEFIKSYEELLESLPPKRRDIFRMRVQDGLSTKIISMHLGISRKTVQNQLGKAIQTLRISLVRMLTATIVLLISLH